MKRSNKRESDEEIRNDEERQGSQVAYHRRGQDDETRIEELQSEWSLEKIMTVATAGFLLISAFLGRKQRNKLIEFGNSVAEVLGVDSLREWEPPKGVLKKLGIRRQDEIDQELHALGVA